MRTPFAECVLLRAGARQPFALSRLRVFTKV